MILARFLAEEVSIIHQHTVFSRCSRAHPIKLDPEELSWGNYALYMECTNNNKRERERKERERLLYPLVRTKIAIRHGDSAPRCVWIVIRRHYAVSVGL